MERSYDIFETVGEHPIWRGSIAGLEPAIAKMKELAAESENEFKLMHLGSNAVIATMNTKKQAQRQ
jgi:hypothetical protein